MSILFFLSFFFLLLFTCYANKFRDSSCRYINKPLQPLNPTPASAFDREKEWGTRAEKHVSNVGTGLSYNYDSAGASQRAPKSVITLATGQSNHSEAATYCSQQRVFPLPIPVKGIRINSPCSGYGSVVPTVFCSQSGSSSMVSPSSVAQQQESQFVMNTFYQTNPEKNKSDQPYDPVCRNTNMATDQAIHNQEHKLDSLDNRGHISPTTDQSASSSFCNGNVSHLNSIGYGSACGSNSNVDQVVLVRTVSESKNDESYFTNNTNSHRSIQREAALTKFRMKRKDRCFEKKVQSHHPLLSIIFLFFTFVSKYASFSNVKFVPGSLREQKETSGAASQS